MSLGLFNRSRNQPKSKQGSGFRSSTHHSSIRPTRATNGIQSPNGGTFLAAVRCPVTVALGAMFTLNTERARQPASITVPAALSATARCASWDSHRGRYRRFSIRVDPMAEVNRFPGWFRRPSAGQGPFAVCVSLEVPSVCSRPWTGKSACPSSAIPFRAASNLSPGASTASLPSLEPSLRCPVTKRCPWSTVREVVAGFLEHRLEVRPRGLQSILVRPHPALSRLRAAAANRRWR
jgi:hypothetical protein